MSESSSITSISASLARGAVVLFALFLLFTGLLDIFGPLTPLSEADPTNRPPQVTAFLLVYAGVLLAPRMGNDFKGVALFKQVMAWSGIAWFGFITVEYLVGLAGGKKTVLGLPFLGAMISAAVLGALLIHFATRRLET